jgi:hypothetical protein
MSRKHEECWQFIHGQNQAKGLRKRPSAKRGGKLLNLIRNWLRIVMAADRTLILKDVCLNWGWWTFLGVIDAKHSEEPHMFFMTVRH